MIREPRERWITLMRAAAALYETKQRGRNRVVQASIHAPGLPPPDERRGA